MRAEENGCGVLEGGGRKLEDFLGGSVGSSAGGAGVCLIAGESPAPAAVSEPELYDSELKSIAASFLRGFTADQNDTQKQQAAAAPPPDPPAKKAAETFGQRTSIYRGVTRLLIP